MARAAGFVIGDSDGASGTPDRRRVVKLAAEATNGSVGVIRTTVRPGVLVPPHYHDREDEVWHILSGRVHCLLGDEVYAASAGDFIWRPRGHVHASWVGSGDEAAMVVSFLTPGGWEGELLVLDQNVAAGDFVESEFVETATRYGIHFDFETGRVIADRYGLALMGAGG